MKLTIISPQEKNIMAVAWFEVNTPAGNFVIQRGHAPTLLTLTQGKPFTFCLRNGKQETITPTGGILEIKRDQALLLLPE